MSIIIHFHLLQKNKCPDAAVGARPEGAFAIRNHPDNFLFHKFE